jgi:MFS family permease
MAFCLIGIILVGIIQIQNFAVFFVVRFFQGIMVGLFLVLVPTFIKEVTPIEISKNIIFGVFEKLFVLTGFVLPFSFNTILLKKDIDETLRWRIVITVDALPLFILLILLVAKIIP